MSEYSIDKLINTLDKLSWGFSIQKWQERDCKTVWKITFIDPKTKIWKTVDSSSLEKSLQLCIAELSGLVGGF